MRRERDKKERVRRKIGRDRDEIESEKRGERKRRSVPWYCN